MNSVYQALLRLPPPRNHPGEPGVEASADEEETDKQDETNEEDTEKEETKK